MKMIIVFDELLSNIIQYAFDYDGQYTIHIDIIKNGNNLIVDDGVPFNPFQQNKPDTKLSIEERGIGGLGIHLVKNLMDECNYSRHTNQNTLTLVKYDINN